VELPASVAATNRELSEFQPHVHPAAPLSSRSRGFANRALRGAGRRPASRNAAVGESEPGTDAHLTAPRALRAGRKLRATPGAERCGAAGRHFMVFTILAAMQDSLLAGCLAFARLHCSPAGSLKKDFSLSSPFPGLPLARAHRRVDLAPLYQFKHLEQYFFISNFILNFILT